MSCHDVDLAVVDLLARLEVLVVNAVVDHTMFLEIPVAVVCVVALHPVGYENRYRSEV